MIPSFFPDGSGQLFGVRHPPLAKLGRRRAALLCQPWGPEYVRTHRAFRQLAVQLSGRGFDVLRFDYFGSGDSAGEGTEATLERWVDDIGAAAEELRRGSDVEELIFVGLRLGAALALVAAGRRADVASLVLWEPFEDGDAHLAELLAAQAEWERRKSWFDSGGGGGSNGGGALDLLGFPATPRFLAELKGFRAWTGKPGAIRRALLVEHEARAGSRKLQEALVGAGILVDHRVVPAPRIWDVLVRASALVPRATLDCVVDWCAKGTP
jgi:pimeloyl-ACP methyl ester carboxylesterase